MTVTLLFLAAQLTAATPPVWRYDARFDGQALHVEARLPPGSGQGLALDAPRFVTGAKLGAIDCRAGCRVRYRFALDDAAAADRGSARHGAIWTTRPGGWLARPGEAPEGATFELRVVTPPGVRVAAGLRRIEGGFTGPAAFVDHQPEIAFGPLELRSVSVRGGRIEVGWARGALSAGPDALTAWVSANAGALARYLGRFPVPEALVLALPSRGDGVPFGTAQGYGGALVKLYVGRDADAGALDRDWKLRHELAHLALPNLGPAHRWMEEGLATYVESVLEARLGRISAEALWDQLAEGFAKGTPRGDPLDGTRRWGETYWGGALFWCIADLEIRAATDGRLGLEDALRASVGAGGTMRARWPVRRLLAAMDAALPHPVLGPLHARFGVRGDTVDLGRLGAKIGVGRGPSGEVRLRDDAPWAAHRARIEASWVHPK